MKKEKLNWYILLGSAALTILFAVLTIAEMIENFTAVSVIALVVEIFAMGVIASCVLQEKKEMGDASTGTSMEETNDVYKEVATEEATEEPITEEPVEEVGEKNDYQEEPEEINN